MVAIAIYGRDAAWRERLERRLGGRPEIIVVSSAATMADVLDAIGRQRVDVVVAAEMPDLPVPQIPLVLLDDGGSIEALRAGVAALVPPDGESDDIAAAVVAASRGLSVIPRRLLAELLGREAPDGLGSDPLLTPREVEVLAAMADGASNKAIARRLRISFHTVKFHVASILAKLEADSRTEAVARAARLGLVML